MTSSRINFKLFILLFSVLSLNIMISSLGEFEAQNVVLNEKEPLPSVLNPDFNATLYCNYTGSGQTINVPSTFSQSLIGTNGFNGVNYKMNPTSITYLDDTIFFGDAGYNPYLGSYSNTTAGTPFNYTLGAIITFPYFANVTNFHATGSGNATGGTNVYFKIYNTTISSSVYVKDTLIGNTEIKNYPSIKTTNSHKFNKILDNYKTTDDKFIIEANVTQMYKEFCWANGTYNTGSQVCYLYNDTIYQDIIQSFRFYLDITLPTSTLKTKSLIESYMDIQNYYSMFENFTITEDIYLTYFQVYGRLDYSGITFKIWNSRWDNGFADYRPNIVVATLGTVYTTGVGMKRVNTGVSLSLSDTLDGVYFIEISGTYGFWWAGDYDYMSGDEAVLYFWDGSGTTLYKYPYDYNYQYGYYEAIPSNRIEPYLTINSIDYQLRETATVLQADIHSITINVKERWPNTAMQGYEEHTIFAYRTLDVDIDHTNYNWQYDKLIASGVFAIDSPSGFLSYRYVINYPANYEGLTGFKFENSGQNVTMNYGGSEHVYNIGTYRSYVYIKSQSFYFNPTFLFIVYDRINTTRNEEFQFNYMNDTNDDNEGYSPVTFSLFYLLMIPLTIGVAMLLILTPSKKYQTVTDAVGL